MTKVQFEINQSQSVVSNKLAYECLKINWSITMFESIER